MHLHYASVSSRLIHRDDGVRYLQCCDFFLLMLLLIVFMCHSSARALFPPAFSGLLTGRSRHGPLFCARAAARLGGHHNCRCCWFVQLSCWIRIHCWLRFYLLACAPCWAPLRVKSGALRC